MLDVTFHPRKRTTGLSTVTYHVDETCHVIATNKARAALEEDIKHMSKYYMFMPTIKTTRVL